MPNIYAGTNSGNTPLQKDVDSASKEVVAENYSRTGLVLTNLSDGTIYISFGNAAIIGGGIVLLPFGGAFVMSEYTYSKELVTAIAHSDNSALAIQEFLSRS